MDGILSFSDSHKRILRSYGSKPGRAELYYFQRMLRKYAQRLSQPITKDDADSMFATTTFLNAISFALIETERPTECWPLKLNTNNCCLQWMSIQRGLRPMILITQPWREDSVFNPSFADFKQAAEAFIDERQGREGLPTELADLCDITDESTVDNNPYHGALRLLSILLRIECTSETVGLHIAFTCSMRPEFFALVQGRDPRALLLLSYWFALLCTFDECWSMKPAKTECAAICIYLDKIGDPRIRDLLRFPARACGYDLSGGYLFDFDDDESDEGSPPYVSCAPM
jgi:hypothetical protein